MTTRSTLAAAVLVTLSVAPAGAATICVSPAGGACQTSIQNAVNMTASPGDIVMINPGVYYENVVVGNTHPGIVIAGASKTLSIIDADAPNTGSAITIQAPNVTVKNLTIRNGVSHGVDVQANSAVINGIRVLNLHENLAAATNGNGVNVADTYTGVQVLLSEFRAILGYGIYMGATNHTAIVKGNSFYGVSTGAVAVAGDNVQATANKVYGYIGLSGSFGIVVQGATPVISTNILDLGLYQGYGIYALGTNPVVQGNRLTNFSTLVASCTTCTGGSVTGNTLSLTGALGGLVAQSDAAGLKVATNRVTYSPYNIPSVYISGTGITASGNVSSDNSFGSCFRVAGTGHTVTSNIGNRCGLHGFQVNANSTTLNLNQSLGSNANGFLVDGDAGTFSAVTLTSNKSTGVNGQGFAVIDGAVNTALNTNASTKARVDFCDQGTGTTLSGNLFTTTAAVCDILQ